MHVHQRRRLIVSPRFQCTQLGAVVVTLALITGLYSAILAWVFYELVVLGEAIQLSHSHYYFAALADIKGTVKIAIGFVFAGTLLLAVYGGLVRTRRIVGPIQSLMRHLNALAHGHAPDALAFRREDCFGELADSFNAFRKAEHASRRQGS